jgi:hypothetical protein
MSIRSSYVFSPLPRVGPSIEASPILRLELQAKSVSSIITRLSFHIIQNWQIMSHPLDRYYRIFPAAPACYLFGIWRRCDGSSHLQLQSDSEISAFD